MPGYHIVDKVSYTLIYTGGTVSFSPQNYSIPEGIDAELNIVLDKAFATDLRFEVATMDGTATCE